MANNKDTSTRNPHISVYGTQEELDEIRALAKEANLSISSYLKSLALDGVQNTRPHADYGKMGHMNNAENQEDKQPA